MNRWSFSSWSTYNTCPLKFKFRYLDRIKPPQAPAANRGENIHKTVEDYIKNPAYPYPPDLSAHRFILDAYRNHPGERYCELVLCFNSDWELVAPIDRDKIWCQMVLDAARVHNKDSEGVEAADVEEWKTGREYDEHKEQRSLYALGALLRWRYVDVVRVTTRYLDKKADDKRLGATRSAEDKLKELWTSRVDTMDRDQIHAPRPGHYCRWCHYSRVHKGGPCPVG